MVDHLLAENVFDCDKLFNDVVHINNAYELEESCALQQFALLCLFLNAFIVVVRS